MTSEVKEESAMEESDSNKQASSVESIRVLSDLGHKIMETPVSFFFFIWILECMWDVCYCMQFLFSFSIAFFKRMEYSNLY